MEEENFIYEEIRILIQIPLKAGFFFAAKKK